MLLANSTQPRVDQVAVPVSAAKGERRVVERGTSASQAAIRIRLSAVPMKRCPKGIVTLTYWRCRGRVL